MSLIQTYVHILYIYYTGRNLTGTPRYASINNHKGIRIIIMIIIMISYNLEVYHIYNL